MRGQNGEKGRATRVDRADLDGGEQPHAIDFTRLLRARPERPSNRCAAEQRDELATFHVGHGSLLPRLMPTPDTNRPWRCSVGLPGT